MHRGSGGLIAAAAALFLSLASGTVASAQVPSPLRIEDLFRIEEYAGATISPDGGLIAVVIRRPMSPNEVYRRDVLMRNDHADIWLFPVDGGMPRNLTEGAADASGYWNPVWSPDGARLAMLSTRGQDNVRLLVWDRGTDDIAALDERGVDLDASMESGASHLGQHAMLWLNPDELVTTLLPHGVTPTIFDLEMRGPRIATDQWARVVRGREVTASVLESGRSETFLPPASELVVFHLGSGRRHTVLEAKIRQVLVSPDGRGVAVLEDIGPRPARPDVALRWNNMRRTRLRVGRLADAVLHVVDGPLNPSASLLGSDVHAWDPSGRTFAVLAQRSETEDDPTTVFLVDVDGAAAASTGPELAVSTMVWSGNGTLIAHGRASGSRETGHWWILDRTHDGLVARKLTTGLETMPFEMLPGPVPHELVGVADGDLVAIDVRDGSSRVLTAALEPPVVGILWPDRGRRAVGATDLVVVTGAGEGRRLHHVRMTDTISEPRALRIPVPGATLADFRPELGVAAVHAARDDGSFLWIGDASGRMVLRETRNQHLATLATGRRQLLEYRSLDGDSLRALLILPVAYQAGQQYPMVTWVYGGSVVSDTAYSLADRSTAFALNLQLLAAAGYAVLVPSIPLAPEGTPSDPLLGLSSGVLPAVERVIDMGIADPHRLALLGQSYGAYSTVGLIALSDRFHAAIALAGLPNLIGLYGAFDARFRYGPDPHENLFVAMLAESGQGRMGVPPWSDFWRYMRNSPYFFVDRIRTPLLLIHGDQDYVPIQQAEELFTALYRMGRRARFVRYWGEGHVIRSPANISDMWGQIFEWLDEHIPDRR